MVFLKSEFGGLIFETKIFKAFFFVCSHLFTKHVYPKKLYLHEWFSHMKNINVNCNSNTFMAHNNKFFFKLATQIVTIIYKVQ